MALPPRGDPRRDLALAIRNARALSLLMVPVFLLVSVVIRPGSYYRISGIYFALYAFIALVIVGFWISTLYLSLKQKWAIRVLMAESVILILPAIAGLFASILDLNIIGGAICLFWCAAMGQFIVYLSGAGKGIDQEMMMKNNWTGGFEPIMKKQEQ